MASRYRKRRSFKRKSFVRPKRRVTRFKSRRSFRRKSRGSRHGRSSSRRLGSLLPDIGVTKMKAHNIRINMGSNNLDEPLVLQPTTANNTVSIIMNSNPNGGLTYFNPGFAAPLAETYNPVDTWTSKYTGYRPMGCKVDITLWPQDVGENPMKTIAAPFALFGFPAVTNYAISLTDNISNFWDGTSGTWNLDTVPQMKYGFKRICTGFGGKSGIRYSTYWDFAKILGWTREQYISNKDEFVNCFPDDGTTNPTYNMTLVLGIADFTAAVQRSFTMDIHLTQYGRWEGQQLDIF